MTLKQQQVENISNHILSLIWLLFLILPNNQMFFVFVPVAYLVLFSYKKTVDRSVALSAMMLIILLALTFLVNIGDPHNSQNLQDIFRLVVIMLMLFTFGKQRGSVILKPYIYFAIGYLVTTQFAVILNISFLNTLMSIYAISEEAIAHQDRTIFLQENYEYSLTSNIFRLGGIFFNSNQYARYLGLIMLVLLCEIRQFSKKSLLIIFPIIILSIVASGSRTALIVFVATILFYIHSTKIFSPKKTGIISTIFVLLLLFIYLFTELSELRIFQLEAGIDNSFRIKVQKLINYLNSNPSTIRFLFGNLTGDAMLSDGTGYLARGFRGMDWEIGNLILVYGVLFLIFILVFYVLVFKKYLPKYRVIFTILIWMMSSSVLLNYRMAALWMLVLGLYYRRSLLEKEQINNEKNER